jgi:nucleoside 2-deoxyribosyltransferase
MRTIKISVGYGWSDGPVNKDERWQGLREFCRAAADHGRKMAAAALTSSVSYEEQESSKRSADVALPGVTVARLRASVGRFTWESVRQHIDSSDILLFDLTPTKRSDSGLAYLSANVWIEIGYALAKPQKPVFIVHSDTDGYKDLPSDLSGLVIGHLPSKTQKKNDVSLRMSLASEVRKLAIQHAEDAALV